MHVWRPLRRVTSEHFTESVSSHNHIYFPLYVCVCPVQVDARDNYNPGWKYNHWELKGVPIRVEV